MQANATRSTCPCCQTPERRSPSPKSRISIIVPAYGVARFVGEALASLQAQTSPNWEAIIVDDGAPDDVEGALRPFMEDPRFRLLQTDNRGPSVARNRGAAAARSSLLSLLDGDDAYYPTYVEEMLAVYARHPTLGFVTCDATYFGETGRAGRRYSDTHEQTGEITLGRVLAGSFNVFVGSAIRKDAFEFDRRVRPIRWICRGLGPLDTTSQSGIRGRLCTPTPGALPTAARLLVGGPRGAAGGKAGRL